MHLPHRNPSLKATAVLALVAALAPAARPQSILLQSDGDEAAALRRLAAVAPSSYTRLDLPRHFLTVGALRFDNTPDHNETTDSGATLGRFLFYDTRLSGDGTLSCGSCHEQARGFTDPNRFSRGFEGRRTDRKSMNLMNLRFHPGNRFFWDERVEGLEHAVLEPIQSHVELGQSLERLEGLIAADPSYAPLFSSAFGTAEVTVDRIARALAQFLRSLVSYRSPYDEGMAQVFDIRKDFPNFTPLENRGKAIFARSCKPCHMRFQDAHFNVLDPLSNGLDDDVFAVDGGAGDVSLVPRDLGRFKSPGLRNVAVTGPYMHDGRFETLEEVVEHYSSGIEMHPNLGNEGLRRLGLDATQKAALVAFLETLTDRAFLTDPRFSNPYAKAPGASSDRGPVTGADMDRAQILAWLSSHDRDRDGTLDRDELLALAPVLAREGLARGDRRRNFGMEVFENDQHQPAEQLSTHGFFVRASLLTLDRDRDGTLGAEELADHGRLLALGDRNGDDAIHADELSSLVERLQNEAIPPEVQHLFTDALVARAHPFGERPPENDRRAALRSALELVIEAPAGGPIVEGLMPNRVHDALATMELPPETRDALIELFDRGRVDRAEAARQRIETLDAIRRELGDEVFIRFEEGMVEARERERRERDAVLDRLLTPEQLADAVLARLDRDASGALDAFETRQFAARLETLAGGFDVDRPAVRTNDPIEDHTIAAKVLSFDRDGDGFVSKDELPERMHGMLARHDEDANGRIGAEELALQLERRDHERRLERLRTGSIAPDRVSLKGIFNAAGRPRGLDKDRVEEVLDDMGVTGGARRRVLAAVPDSDEAFPSPSRRHALLDEMERIMGDALFDVFVERVVDQEFAPMPSEHVPTS